MKVVCVYNIGLEKYLTLNKTYDVISISSVYYINNDIYQNRRYKKIYFKTISEYRNDKIDKLLGE